MADNGALTDSSQRQPARLRHVLLGCLAGLLVLAVVAAGMAFHAYRTQRAIVVSRELVARSQALAGSDPLQAQLTAAAAWRIAPDPYTRSGMLRMLANPAHRVLTETYSDTGPVAFTPDGSAVASTGEGGAIRLWDTMTGQPGRSFNPQHEVFSLAYSRHGVLAAAGDAGRTRLWFPDGRMMLTQGRHGDEVFGMAFSPDGDVLATGAHEVLLWDAATGRRIGKLSRGLSDVQGLAYRPDGKVLAVADRSGGVQLWSPRTMRRSGVLKHPGQVESVAFSPDGDVLAVSTWEGEIRLWDPQTRRLRRVLQAHSHGVYGVAFSPDGTLLASGGADGVVRLWDTTAWRPLATLHAGTEVRHVLFSPDGTRLATGGHQARLWDNPIGRPIVRDARPVEGPGFPSPLDRPVLSRDGTTLVTDGRGAEIRLWHTRTGDHVDLTLRDSTPLALSRDGGLLALRNAGGLTLWNTRTGREIRNFHGDGVFAVMVGRSKVFGVERAADGPGSLSGTDLRPNGLRLRVWDFGSGNSTGVLKIPEDYLSGLAVSSDETLLATYGLEGVLRLRDARSGRSIRTLRFVRDNGVKLEFSPDSRLLAAGTADHGTVTVWSTTTDTRPIVLPGHVAGTRALAYTRDGSLLAVGAGDGAIRLWDLRTGESITELPGHTEAVSALAFRSDGALVSVGVEGAVRAWDLSYLGDPYRELCRRVGRSMTRAEWQVHIPDLPYRMVC